MDNFVGMSINSFEFLAILRLNLFASNNQQFSFSVFEFSIDYIFKFGQCISRITNIRIIGEHFR